MSAAAGAPPPPPPPPNHFSVLPAELLLQIIEQLSIQDFVRLALVYYPLLRRHNLVPPMTRSTFESLLKSHKTFEQRLQMLRLNDSRTTDGSAYRRSMPLVNLPNELKFEILSYLAPAEVMAWLLSDPVRFSIFFSIIDEGTIRGLEEAITEDGVDDAGGGDSDVSGSEKGKGKRE
ncbi:hypothetical protein P280DRAFT_322561 [Massarina eburnea CBS 473.64]|uniref:F-box domain-containing protein n=1 Tax=Massarina eburnea CBS 473.64 TaxID=1395130 RepID=A0A6A6S0M1_9PLEO|nr:hypothetical protein P280DRAFT_322561 [Massarina eburnea CBS 473.64]